MIQFCAILLIPSLQRAKRQIDIDNGVIKIEPIPDLPDTNWSLAFKHPKMYRSNKRLARQLIRQKKERENHDSLEPSDEDGNIILMVMMVLFDGIGANDRVDGSVNSDLPTVVINKDTVERLLDAFGFRDLKTDDVLVSQMVQAAGGPGTILDETTFARALTADVNLRTVGIEDELSETFEDVYGYNVTSLEYVVGRRINRRRKEQAEEPANFHEKPMTHAGVDEENGIFSIPLTPAPSFPPAPSVSDTNISSSVQQDENAAPAHNEPGYSEWVSFDDDDNNTVDWSTVKQAEVSISSSGEIEVSNPPTRREQAQLSSVSAEGKTKVESEGKDKNVGIVIETKRPPHVSAIVRVR